MKRTYQYAGLQNTTQQGFSVDQCAARLHRFAYAAERLMFLQAAHIISTPERDVKVLLARLQYEDSQHASQFKARLPELRVSKKKSLSSPLMRPCKWFSMKQCMRRIPLNCWRD